MMNFRHRSKEIEIMDDLHLNSPELYKTLDEIALINQYLGGHNTVIKAIENYSLKMNQKKPISIVDLGCGKGDTLRAIQKRFSDDFEMNLQGVDANEHTVKYARDFLNDPSIEIRQALVNENFMSVLNADIVILSLFLHHFNDEEIDSMMSAISKNQVGLIVINDLQRSRLALWLYNLMTFAFRLNPMARKDGGISIRKGFVKEDLSKMLKRHFSKFTIKWKWAFRYQVIIFGQ